MSFSINPQCNFPEFLRKVFYVAIVSIVVVSVFADCVSGQQIRVQIGNAVCQAFPVRASDNSIVLVTCGHCVASNGPVYVFFGSERVAIGSVRVFSRYNSGLDAAVIVDRDSKSFDGPRIVQRLRDKFKRNGGMTKEQVAMIERLQDLFDDPFRFSESLPEIGDVVTFIDQTGTRRDTSVLAVRWDVVEFKHAPIQGDSGSPLVNESGDVVGIVSYFSDRCTGGVCTRIGGAANTRALMDWPVLK